MIAEAVSAGADALVFSAIDYENNASAIDAAAEAGVKVVAIDSSVASEVQHLHRNGQSRGGKDGGARRRLTASRVN